MRQSQISLYNSLQVIGPAGIEKSRVELKFLDCDVERFRLYSQMRVQGGGAYIDYVVKLLSGGVTKKETIKNYKFKMVNDFKNFNRLVFKMKEQH